MMFTIVDQLYIPAVHDHHWGNGTGLCEYYCC